MADTFQNSYLERGFLLFNVNRISGNGKNEAMHHLLQMKRNIALIFKDISWVFLSSIVNSF